MIKYTKEQLQAMSDFERNKLLATLSGETVGNKRQQKFAELDEDLVVVVRDGNIDVVDYCNTPNDIMPLAFEHGVNYKKKPSIGKFVADYAYDIATNFIDTKPLRAIACCLILVLQEKQNG